jgi:predicted TIM-barrel fold metal-dependent hydrolase
MPTLIDWHAHHTAPEVVTQLAEWSGRNPRPDSHDSTNFASRIAEMDGAGVDLQLVCMGAGLNPDDLPPDQAMAIVRASNNRIAERIAPYPDRLLGVISVSYTDVDASVAEIDRLADRGFRAVMLFARPDLVGGPQTERLFARAAARRLPIFLHGGGGSPNRDPALARLEDGGQGVTVSAHADGAVSDFVVRMIAAGVFDRYPELEVVIRSGGGTVPLLLHKLWWKHKGPGGEQRYSEVLREHFLVDCASTDARTLSFLIDTMGQERVVFGSDYCGGLGPLRKALPTVDEQPDPAGVKALMDRNSRRLLRL